MDLAQKNLGKGISPERKLNKGGKVADGRCLRAFRILTAYVGRLLASRYGADLPGHLGPCGEIQ